MRTTKKPFVRLVCLSLASATMALPEMSAAQSSDAGFEGIEEVVVTGSRIKRRDMTATSPISTLERMAIEDVPQPTLEEALNQMPQVTPDSGRTSNNPGTGTARINLRGMGAERTLVLLNGRRMAPSGTGSAVDLNNIPNALIERVEIITGGASIVYGSDALAGVVNVITRTDLDGFSFDGGYGVSEQGDASYTNLSLTFGSNFADGRGHVAVYGNYYDREELFASERKLSRVVWSEDLDTGTLVQGGSYSIPETALWAPVLDFGNGPEFATFNPDGTPRPFIDPDDRYNYQPVNYLQVPLERYAVGVMADFEIGEDFELYLESAYTKNDARSELAPVPATGWFAINEDNPAITPEFRLLLQDWFANPPFQHSECNAVTSGRCAPIRIGRRMSDLGPRHIQQESDYWRTVVGIRGDLGRGWELDGWVTYTKSDEYVLQFNDASITRLQQSLLVDPVTGACYDPTGGCVALDPFGEGSISPEAGDFIRHPALDSETQRTQILASVFVRGAPFDTWAGPVDTAFGLEWRSDEASYKANDILFGSDTLGYRADSPVLGTETVAEAYFEAVVPLLADAAAADYLGLEVGARYSDYDNAGGVWTYKLGSAWQPNEAMRFSVMVQHSVRAPNNQELFKEQYRETWSFTGQNFPDPCSASQDPVGNGHTERCVIQGLPANEVGVFEANIGWPADYIYGGNPALEPEEGETLTIRWQITPPALPNWNFSIDYFDMEITGATGEIEPDLVCFDQANVSNEFCDKLQRDFTGNVVLVDSTLQNRGLISTRGVDTQITYVTELPQSWSLPSGEASLEVHLIWTHMIEILNQENKVSTTFDCAGYFANSCVSNDASGTASQDRVSARFSYMSGPLGVSLMTRWVKGTDNFMPVFFRQQGWNDDPIPAIPSIGSEFLADLNIRYQFTDGISAGLGISNLFDSEPSINPWAQHNADAQLFDIFGRYYSLSLRMDF